MTLERYLERIGLEGATRPDIDTLAAVMRAQIMSVPFENLDVLLQRPLTTDVAAAYEKIVARGRGGWCYELNGLLGWALSEIGFDVKRLAGGVMRAVAGDGAFGNHLCLLVECGGTFLVDAGFGGSLTTPLPLQPIERRDPPYDIALNREADGYWRFSESAGAAPFGFDFRALVADEELLQAKCDLLQSDANSTFVMNLVAQQRRPDEHLILRGRVLTRVTCAGSDKVLINSAAELSEVLGRVFRLFEPAVTDLWPMIEERHDALFPDASP